MDIQLAGPGLGNIWPEQNDYNAGVKGGGHGTAEIIHAAHRGENISVFFINNAICGMTGGQMAPTTILKQKTATTPRSDP